MSRPGDARALRIGACLGLLAVLLLAGAGLRRAPTAGSGQHRPAVAPAPARAPFDRARAFADLERQVGFGPRVPGMEGHSKALDYLVKTLEASADSVQRQPFSRTVRGRRLEMSNVVARWKGTGGKNGVLLSAHWDTRPSADEDPDPRKRRQPIDGANDGASGVAVLLEVGRVLKQSPPPVPVMMVFFDGEDYGPGIEHMFLGSRYFADHLPADVPKRGILLDMVGDKDLEIPQEYHSRQHAPQVVAEVYGHAHRLGLQKQFPARPGLPIMDDHLPLIEKGLQVIDLIDFNYGPGNSWWHTHEDTVDKCSPDSLKAVGDVVLSWLYAQK